MCYPSHVTAPLFCSLPSAHSKKKQKISGGAQLTGKLRDLFFCNPRTFPALRKMLINITQKSFTSNWQRIYLKKGDHLLPLLHIKFQTWGTDKGAKAKKKGKIKFQSNERARNFAESATDRFSHAVNMQCQREKQLNGQFEKEPTQGARARLAPPFFF